MKGLGESEMERAWRAWTQIRVGHPWESEQGFIGLPEKLKLYTIGCWEIEESMAEQAVSSAGPCILPHDKGFSLYPEGNREVLRALN